VAIAHEESTTAWPWAARLSQPPGSEGASAAPIGRKCEFISAAAASAAAGPPPPARIETTANCADPAKTIADMTIAPSAEKPTRVAG
jgi:hypothetical protein